MKCLRSLVLLVCMAPFWCAAGPAHASQSSSADKPAARHEKSGSAASAPRKQASAPRKAPAKVSRSKRKASATPASKPLPKAKLDLSLPASMVNKLEPEVDTAPLARKPVLPAMFTEKPAPDTPFQLNGRLISNEMDLQLRNDSRRDVEGAAIDFEFRQ
ncbi:MAG TPA: hypothetical protein VJS90_02230 [Pseudomonas sp.]|uniref:hypothetical protein n=1 Tax=Pseudomonas sp. TaxID=306 RepID=UPI002B49366E|nr:hypothetical protein [Pseudomonas sp.]HKS11834.1 hypothetical protein [Pseudomonas sp.]